MADVPDGVTIPARLAHLRILTEQTDEGWVSYLRENPEVRAVGATTWEAVSKVQVLTFRWFAESIEQGNPPPAEFCIAVGTAAKTPGQAYRAFIERCAAASELFLDASTQRQAATVSLGASLAFLSSLGVDQQLLMPLARLELALWELQEGGRDSLLAAQKQTTRPKDAIAVRVARAAVAAALELRMTFLGEKLDAATARVVANAEKLNIRLSGGKRDAQPVVARVKQLRLDFRSPKSKAPKTGLPRHLWNKTIERAAAAPRSTRQRTQYLEALYDSVLLEAVHYSKISTSGSIRKELPSPPGK